MAQTNVTYNDSSDEMSLSKCSSNEEELSSSDLTKEIDIVLPNDKDTDLDNLSSKVTGQRYADDSLLQQKVMTIETEHASLANDDPYYYLKHLRQSRRGKRDEDSALPKRVKRFYKKQDELINTYECTLIQQQENGIDNDTCKNQQERDKQKANILTRVSLGVNIVRMIRILFNKISIIYIASVYSY